MRNPQIHNNNYRARSGKVNRALAEDLPHLFPRRSEPGHTEKEWIDKITQHGIECHYCKEPLNTSSMTKDHLTPICRHGSDSIDNIVPCCLPCNQRKCWRTEDEYREMLARPSTAQKRYRAKTNINPFPSLEERVNEPGLLKRVRKERERVSWSWRHPAA